MKRSYALPALALLSAALWLGGCNQQKGTEVTVRLVNQWGTPATATVIYQVGDGEWKLAAQKEYGVYSFVVPPGETRYGVSTNCIPGISFLSTFGFFTTYQLTTDDATAVTFSCLNLSDQKFTEVTLNWDVSAVGGDRMRWVTLIEDDDDTTSPDTVAAVTGAQQPFLFLAYLNNTSFSSLEGVRFGRFDVDPYDTLDVTFTAGDAPALGAVSGPATPTGFADCELDAVFATPEGLWADNLADGGGSPCTGSFVKIPGAGSGDVYAIQANYQDFANDRSLISTVFPEAAGIGDVTLPALPAPWPTSYSVTAAALPTFDLNHPDGNATGYMVLYGTTTAGGGPFAFWQVFISPNWLGSATQYTLPDLTDVPDFGGLKPLSGDDAMWMVAAFFSDRPIGDWLSSTSWVPTGGPVVMPIVPGARMTAAGIDGDFTVP